jgi:probable phosphoglycerate mutase
MAARLLWTSRRGAGLELDAELGQSQEHMMVGLLIPHGHVDPSGRWLAGRRPGVSLNAAGREQTTKLVQALKWTLISAVYASPLERAVETAHPLAADHGLDLRIREALTDLDFGEWTGRTVADLSGDPAWARFNSDHPDGCPPRGESRSAARRRVVEELMTLAKTHPGETIAIVTHGELIRCALAALGDGTVADDVLAIDVDPTRVSAIGIQSGVCRVLGVNLPASEMAV